MPRLDPKQLLDCLSALLASNGGIKSSKEVNRLVQLMGKFSKKLVSKCIYVQILKSTETELLGQFMADGGWTLSHTWLQDGILTRNWPLVQELLELMLLCPVDVQRLKSNSAPKLVKGLSKEGGNEGVRILASKLVEQWLKIVKGETSSLTPVTMPRQDVIVSVLKPETPVVKQESIENGDLLDEADESNDMVDPLELPSNREPEEDVDSKERLAKAKSDGLVFKITVKDGKQVLAKVESSPKKEADAEKAKIKSELNAKIKNEPVVKEKPDSIGKLRIETVDGKKQIKEKPKKDSAKEQDKADANKKVDKCKIEAAKEKSKSDDKERRSSKDSTKDTANARDPKDKEKRKDSSSKSSSSKHSSSSSSRSSSHKLSRSGSDGKHKSSSSSTSRDKSRDGEKDKDRDRSKSSSKSSSRNGSSSSSRSNQPKEKRDSLDDKVSQSMKDKDTLTKVIPPSINKLGKIPKKPASADGDAATAEAVSSKKSSMSIEVKKDAESRPKTVKTFNSQFRSHGLAEEAPPPPSRRGLQRPSSQPTAGASIPATIPAKRTSPPPEKKESAVVPEKKLKIDTTLAVEKPGIKLIPAKPKTPVLVESDMFMDAIFASQPTKKDSARKRKRLTSQSTSETSKPEKVQSPDSKSVAPKFYQDTLDDENKDDDKAEEPKKKDGNVETTKDKETNETADDVEMQETNDSVEAKEAEDVVVENKKPPGPGCGPNGPPGVLTILKRKGPKKQLKWRPQESLEEIHYFELDETERVNVSRSNVDMTQAERFNEREGDAFSIVRKMNADDLMAEQAPWKPLNMVDDVPAHPDGSNSKEKKIQSDRELTCLRAIYFNRSMIPDNPAEPDMEQYQLTDAIIIPLDDANGSAEGIKSFVNYPWPEPRGSPPHQSTGFDDQPPFNNFQPNFPFNNQPGWTPPNVNLPPAFNGPHNMMNMNSIQPEPMNNMNNMNMNMNPMPPFQQNPNFCPPNGMRNNFSNNNFDGRMHGGPPQNNNPNWFRPNGPQNNNWRPPMGNNNNNNNNNNNRSRPDWNPRNICRSFSKGFCRNGDKCQWLHPGINCPPFN